MHNVSVCTQVFEVPGTSMWVYRWCERIGLVVFVMEWDLSGDILLLS